MPDAPAALRRGQEVPDVVGADDGVDRDHAGVGERDHRGALEARAGAPRARPRRSAGAFIITYLRRRPSSTAPEHRVEPVDVVRAQRRARPGCRRGSPRRRAGRRWSAARSWRAWPRSRRGRRSRRPVPGAARPRRRPESGITSTGMARSLEPAAGGARVGRRDAEPGEILDAPLGRHRWAPRPSAGSARSRAERTTGRSTSDFGEEVGAGDPQVGDAVADELDDVVRADEEDVEVDVLDPAHEAPIALLEDEARVVQQVRGWARPAGPCWERRGSSAARSRRAPAAPRGSRPPPGRPCRGRACLAPRAGRGSPPSPWFSHEAIRVIVAVLAPVRREISE